MRRIFALLMMAALVLTNSTAVAAAICQHGSAEAHDHARQSDDAHVEVTALAEEAAAKATSDKGAPADTNGVQLGGLILPTDIVWPHSVVGESLHERAADAAKRPRVSANPPLRPPLA